MSSITYWEGDRLGLSCAGWVEALVTWADPGPVVSMDGATGVVVAG